MSSYLPQLRGSSHCHAGMTPQEIAEAVASAGIEAVKIPPRSPRANSYTERWALIVPSEVTDRMLNLWAAALHAVLDEYAQHYNQHQPHRARNLGPPHSDAIRPAAADPSEGRVRRQRVLGGLISEYKQAA